MGCRPALGNFKINNCFVSDASTNVYLKDVFMDVPFDNDPNTVEFADAHNKAFEYYWDTAKDRGSRSGYYWSVAHPLGVKPGDKYYFGYDNPYKRDLQAVSREIYLAQAFGDMEKNFNPVLWAIDYAKAAVDGLADTLKTVIHDPTFGKFVDWNANALKTSLDTVGVVYEQTQLVVAPITNTLDKVPIVNETVKSIVKFATGSPVYLYSQVTIPDNTDYLEFSYLVERADQDSYLAVLFDADLLFYAPAHALVGEAIYSGPINMANYSGKTGYLTILVDDPNSSGGAEVDLLQMQLTQIISYNPYEFTFTYANGDYYQGTVYARSDHGYYVGYTETKTDENGQTGKYTVTAAKISNNDYAELAGQVFVSTYYDAESKKTFTPKHQGQAVGINHLGSELDYVGVDGVQDYKFGQGYYEADVGDKYTFRYTYANGDYYTGIVYRTPGNLYYRGYKLNKKNETGETGYYQITSMTYTGETANYKLVYVNTYHDGESNKNFTPLHQGQAVGINHLGSELDYVGVDGVQDYKFGQGYYEADVYDKYKFRYTYGNGDWYEGFVYRLPGYAYYKGYKLTKKNELGLTGNYEITDAYLTLETAEYKNVYVDTYHDGESNQDFTPLNSALPAGSAFLTSEVGYIISKTTTHHFGQGYDEADK